MKKEEKFYIFKYEGSIYCKFYNKEFWEWCKSELDKKNVKYDAGVIE